MPAQQDLEGTLTVNGVSTSNPDTNEPGDGPRRSGRARRPTVRDKGEEDELATSTVTCTAAGKTLENGLSLPTRRNPKRKAAAITPVYNLPDNLRETSLAALSHDELQNWLGWVELESEPSFFNVILKQLGVQNIKVQELFSIDEESLGFLPKPVYGLIFLYQYIEEADDDELPNCPDNIWFANQTTDNACATIALLNIIMNCKEIKLGEKLEDFKKATQHLSAAIRGHALSDNSFIRTTHNSVARRLDLLNADLSLLNGFDESRKKRRVTKRRKKPVTEAAFHFIAYVPTDGKVWQLDGLQSDPICLGQSADDWTSVVRPIIEARMLQYESDNMSFNLLALCHTPLDALRQELVTNIRKLLTLEKRVLESPDMSSIAATERTWINGEDESSLAEYGVSKEDIATAEATEEFKGKITKASFEIAEALDLQQRLEDEQKRIRSEYTAELGAMHEDEARVLGRKKDHAPTIHEWARKLAEHGVLQDLIDKMKK